MKKIPFFLLVDTSGKMVGERIGLINSWILELISAFRKEPFLLECLDISLSEYSSALKLIYPLTSFDKCEIPILESRPSTPALLGEALNTFIDELKKLYVNLDFNKNYHSPWILILTGGKPTDTYASAEAVKMFQKEWGANILFGVTATELLPTYKSLLGSHVSEKLLYLIDLNSEGFPKNLIYSFVEADVGDGVNLSSHKEELGLEFLASTPSIIQLN